MKADISIKIAIWLASSLVSLFLVILPSCTHQEEGEQDRNFRTVSKREGQGLTPIPNKGWIATLFDNDTLSINYFPLKDKKVKTIRIYDQVGGLKYINKEPDFSQGKRLKIDCSYFENGEYLILFYLDDEQLVEEIFVLD